MLRARTITKRQKKEAAKKRLGLMLLFIGLLVLCVSLSYAAFLEKPDPVISPLSKDQASDITKINKDLKDEHIDYIEVTTAKDLTYVVKLSKDQTVILDPKKDIGKQLSSLQFILSQLRIEGKTFKRLDFRYQKPIIVF